MRVVYYSWDLRAMHKAKRSRNINPCLSLPPLGSACHALFLLAGQYGSIELSLEYMAEDHMLSVTIHRCRVSSTHTAGAPTERNIAPLQHLICFCGPFAAIIRTTQLAIAWKLTVNCCSFTRLRVVLPHLCSSQCQYNRVYDFFFRAYRESTRTGCLTRT